MPEFQYPGVYVMEVPPAVKPIAGVSTSTAGFVGVADRGPVPGFQMPFGEPPAVPLVTSFAEFTRIFGSYRDDSFLAYAVQSFFDNGGRRAYVVRVIDLASGAGYYSAGARLAAAGLTDTSNKVVLAVVATSPGQWANDVAISVGAASSSSPAFKLVVLEGGVPVEAFDNLSMDPQSDGFVDTEVNTRSRLVRVRSQIPSVPDAVPAFDQVLNLKGTDGQRPSLSISAPTYLAGPLTVFVDQLTPSSSAVLTFRLTVLRGGRTLEVFSDLTMDPTLGSYAVTKINARSQFIHVTFADGSPPTFDLDKSRPLNGPTTFLSVGLPAWAHYAAGAGSDGAALTTGNQLYVGRADLGTGLHGFDRVRDVNIIAIPGQGTDAIVSAGMAYCRNRPLQDAFLVADLGTMSTADARQPDQVPDANDKAQARDFVLGLSTPTDFGAVYYPWVRASDPIGRGRNPTILLPPSGFIAGLYARIDNSRGVFKAPAGTETGLAGALGVSADIGDVDQGSLNPIGLNVIRRFPVYGIVCWGSRTVSPDPAWRYVPVRRTAIFLRSSIYQGIQWAVFEPNDEPLWAELRLNINAFMLTQFRAGAFQGSAPADAYFVRCDRTTTTQQDIDNGVVNILVGFAPLKPAEFVVLRLSQKVNQAAA
jgi:Bacteriophage tail sheath protein